jgi:hypothetical protein
MNLETFDKRQVATRQLETAIELFESGGDRFSVITLAGAAAEIFDTFIKRKEQTPGFESFIDGVVKLSPMLTGEPMTRADAYRIANYARNGLKHADRNGPTVTLDVEEEAIDMIKRAISGFWQLECSLTLAMQRFEHGHPPDVENAQTEEPAAE